MVKRLLNVKHFLKQNNEMLVEFKGQNKIKVSNAVNCKITVIKLFKILQVTSIFSNYTFLITKHFKNSLNSSTHLMILHLTMLNITKIFS